LPSLLVQPVDSDDFAEYVVECLLARPGGDRADITGPEKLTLDELGRQFLAATEERRPLLRIPVPDRFAAAAGGLAASDARHGKTTWAAWLRRQQAEQPSD
jgi:uncharacterized protein YbjT (DUF2867 family)